MDTVISRDGTAIAFDRRGYGGPPLVLVGDGAAHRRVRTPLAEALAARFTVYTYDRRGRGDSGDILPWAPEREFDDLRAVLEAAGGLPYVVGGSVAALVVLAAAARGLPIGRVAVWEPSLGGTEVAGYDAAMARAFSAAAMVTVGAPVLVADSGLDAGMTADCTALAAVLPDAERRTLHGQPHDPDPAALAETLTAFYRGGEPERAAFFEDGEPGRRGAPRSPIAVSRRVAARGRPYGPGPRSAPR
ncbi:alpha/beta fold hydrolase [Nonomuraea sp. NPDC050328]|uniref:alpha/beta fold hydrolase n=1 Tax=Nonomuraea sp. NPDC050328 TaxID=3364361 RepID=UPI0037BC8902